MSLFAVINVPTVTVLTAYGSLPDFVVWPNGDVSHGVFVGFTHGNEMFVSVIETPAQPGEFYGRGTVTSSLQGSALVNTVTWVPNDLPTTQTILMSRIDSAAEAKRNTLGSGMPGQWVVNLQKWNQAVTCAADPSPNATSYPMLAPLIGVNGSTLIAVATAVLNANNAWMTAVGAIERKRLLGKASINNATSVDLAVAAFSAVVF